MAGDDVWSPGSAGTGWGESAAGTAAYGEGLWINQAFSLETALRLGWAMLVERPVPLLVLGGGLWLLANLPTLVSLPGDVAVGVLEGMGQAEGATVLDLANSLFTLALYAIVFPVQWVLTTGALHALASSLETDEFRWGEVVGHLREGLMVVLYRLLIGVLGVATVLVVLVPATLVAGVLFAVSLEQAGGPMGVFAGNALPPLPLAILGGGALLAFGCWLWVWLPLALGTLAVALDGANPLEGVRIGWRAGRGARATLFVYGLAFAVFALLGCCLFFVGQVFVYGLFLASTTAAWVLYSRPEDAVRAMPFFERNPSHWY